jgi:hypothetical protein
LSLLFIAHHERLNAEIISHDIANTAMNGSKYAFEGEVLVVRLSGGRRKHGMPTSKSRAILIS